jgi:hypothetical protein
MCQKADIEDCVMQGFRPAIFGLAVFALAGVQTSGAEAYVTPPTGQDATSAGSSEMPRQIDVGVVNLSPIVVNGQHMPFPIALQMVKTGLKRPWSAEPADRNKLVCRFEHIFASHLETLMCETNAQYFGNRTKVQSALLKGESTAYVDPKTGETVSGLQVALERGYLTGSVGEFMDQHSINRGALMTILHYLPPAGSSYTLQVTDHGKPILEYVIKDGELVKVNAVKPEKGDQGGG